MARTHARLKLAMWADEDFRDLPGESQWLYMLLMTSSGLSYAGVADWRPARIAPMAVDVSPDRVESAAVELEQNHYIVIDRDTEEVLVRSFIRNDGLMEQPNVAAAMVKAYGAIASRTLQAVIVHELKRLYKEEPTLKAWAARPDVRGLLKKRAMTPDQALEVLPPNMAGFPSDWGHTEPSSNPSGNPSPNPSGTDKQKGSANPSVDPPLTPTPSPTPSPPGTQLRNTTSPEKRRTRGTRCAEHPEQPASTCPDCALLALSDPPTDWRARA
jgi:hypothetical protein